MSEVTIRAEIKDLIEGVANSGVVHDYQRFSAEWDTYLDLFMTEVDGKDVIRGWTITCDGLLQEGFVAGGQRDNSNRKNYRYKIRHYANVDDDKQSEKSILLLIEAVMDVLSANTLHTNVTTVIISTLPQLDPFEPRVFGSTLCHYGEITMTVTEST